MVSKAWRGVDRVAALVVEVVVALVVEVVVEGKGSAFMYALLANCCLILVPLLPCVIAKTPRVLAIPYSICTRLFQAGIHMMCSVL